MKKSHGLFSTFTLFIALGFTLIIFVVSVLIAIFVFDAEFFSWTLLWILLPTILLGRFFLFIIIHQKTWIRGVYRRAYYLSEKKKKEEKEFQRVQRQSQQRDFLITRVFWNSNRQFEIHLNKKILEKNTLPEITLDGTGIALSYLTDKSVVVASNILFDPEKENLVFECATSRFLFPNPYYRKNNQTPQCAWQVKGDRNQRFITMENLFEKPLSDFEYRFNLHENGKFLTVVSGFYDSTTHNTIRVNNLMKIVFKENLSYTIRVVGLKNNSIEINLPKPKPLHEKLSS